MSLAGSSPVAKHGRSWNLSMGVSEGSLLLYFGYVDDCDSVYEAYDGESVNSMRNRFPCTVPCRDRQERPELAHPQNAGSPAIDFHQHLS